MRWATEQPVNRIEYLYAVIGGADAEPIERDCVFGKRVGDGAQRFELAFARVRVEHRLGHLDIGDRIVLFGDKVDLSNSEGPHLDGVSAPHEFVVNNVFQLKTRILGREASCEVAQPLVDGIELSQRCEQFLPLGSRLLCFREDIGFF